MIGKLAVLAMSSAAAIYAADTKTTEIAQAMMSAMGGVDNWNRAHFVRYDFKVTAGGKTAVDRAHLWDKMTGRYRIDGKTKEGKPTVALFNASTKQGAAYVDGKKLEGEAGAKAMKDAYGTFINDMYWLSMPWKWMDMGVHLKYLGQKPRGKDQYDVVELTFGKVGLTPGDRYEAYVSPKSHLMEHWEYTLQSGNKGSWDWEYTTTGGIKLAKNHTSADGKSIEMGDVKVMESADDALFTDPSKPLR
jgi:hypothetical protein